MLRQFLIDRASGFDAVLDIVLFVLSEEELSGLYPVGKVDSSPNDVGRHHQIVEDRRMYRARTFLVRTRLSGLDMRWFPVGDDEDLVSTELLLHRVHEVLVVLMEEANLKDGYLDEDRLLRADHVDLRGGHEMQFLEVQTELALGAYLREGRCDLALNICHFARPRE